ncbi:syntabulin isoform X3 [Bombina bombina]|uniref:syntabulin isoform X3 n=1 Tax=Bombina bombina TaxID=8345 RepID=UPI00235B03E4|nr:syntabulin isoform X3 [Bombina bombina]
MQEKELARSRIPRLVLRPYLPKQKMSPSSESPFSEEESKEFNLTSSRSNRTISSNSFCSDDTGCPSSQSVSPVKTPSDTGISPMGFCTGSEDDYSRKRVNMGTFADSALQPARHRKEMKTGHLKTGSEADFSSSSSTGSISAPEVHMSTLSGGKKASFSRKRTMRYHTSCGDNHGVKPPSPEQYLTPLQQKEVSIRHLKAKLKESQATLQEREAVIQDLKSQLGRMREDWIEEECHRVEAQLALKEARKEIRQLKQFIETMKNSLAEKDKGIQKYFIDINIQNRKLETLLRSMEMAQDSSFRDDQCLDYICNSSGASLTESAIYDKISEGLLLEDQATEEMADCDLLLNDELANRDDLYDDIIMETTCELDNLAILSSTALQSSLGAANVERSNESTSSKKTTDSQWMEQAIQTDIVPFSLDFENVLLKIFKSHKDYPVSRSSMLGGLHVKCFSGSSALIDLTPDDPNSAILLSPESLRNEIPSNSNRAMKELDFEGPSSFLLYKNFAQTNMTKKYWSNNIWTDILAVAVPVIPTVMWAFGAQRGGIDPVYNFGMMMRGCCLMALHSLRKTSYTDAI